MKNFQLGLGALLALGLAACTNDEADNLSASGVDVLTATIDNGNSTRTALGDDGKTVNWVKGDEVSIFTNATSDNNVKYTLDGDGGSTSGSFISSKVFSGTAPTKKAAVYPYNAQATYSNGTISTTLPNEYTAGTESFGNALMACEIGEDAQSALSFKNAGAVIAVTVKNLPAGYKAIELDGGEQTVAGDVTIAFSNGTPTATLGTTNTSTKVTINFDATTESVDSRTFYFPLPVKDFTSNLTCNLVKSDNNTVKLNEAALNAARNTIYSTTVSFDKVAGEIATEASTIANANAALTTTNAVEIDLSSAKDASSAIQIPKNQSSDSSSPVSITLASATASQTIKVEEASSGSGSVAEEVTLSASNAATVDDASNAPSLEVTLPSTTVTLAPAEETVTYNEVTASTADNTLIIKSGVTINKLTVKRGHVKLEAGATVNSIVRDGDHPQATVYVYKPSGATCTVSNGVISTDNEELYNLRVALVTTDKYQLQKDIKMTGALNIKRDFTLDLNGHNITTTGMVNVMGTSSASITVEIKNNTSTVSTITGSKTGIDVKNDAKLTLGKYVKVTETISGSASTGHCAIATRDNTELVVDGATIEDAVFVGISLAPTNSTKTKLTVNEGSTITGASYAICGNGTRTWAESSTIIINGGTLTATGNIIDNDPTVGIYHPQNGTLTVNGGTIKGKDTGIEARGGSVIVKGGKISIETTTASEQSNGNGPTIYGAAISLSQHTTDLTTSVTIQDDAVLEASSNCYAIYEKDEENNTGTKELSVTGGKISGKIYSQNVTKFISGGSFKDYGDSFTSTNYIASGKSLSSSAGTDNYYTVQ